MEANVRDLDFFEVVKLHRSIRSYASTPVSDDDLIRILEAGRLSPSAGNRQPWHFIVVRDREKRIRIAKGCRYGRFLAESPIVIVGCGDREVSPRWYAIDTAIAMEHMVLAAAALGAWNMLDRRLRRGGYTEIIGNPR